MAQISLLRPARALPCTLLQAVQREMQKMQSPLPACSLHGVLIQIHPEIHWPRCLEAHLRPRSGGGPVRLVAAAPMNGEPLSPELGNVKRKRHDTEPASRDSDPEGTIAKSARPIAPPSPRSILTWALSQALWGSGGGDKPRVLVGVFSNLNLHRLASVAGLQAGFGPSRPPASSGRGTGSHICTRRIPCLWKSWFQGSGKVFSTLSSVPKP